LLNLEDKSTPHGLVLKSSNPSKVTLLVPRAERESFISGEKIYALPNLLKEASKYFSGTLFVKDKMREKIIIILRVTSFLSRDKGDFCD
jgi:hypothetical protein